MIIAHRGASGYRPENTLEAFELAIELGAEFLQVDIVATNDGELIVRHDNEIRATTDVATRGEFADRRTKKQIGDQTESGWFTEDFSSAELTTLRANERMPGTRPANHRLNRLYRIPTLTEVLDLTRHSKTSSGRPVGLYLVPRRPSYFGSIGLPLEERLLSVLAVNGYSGRDAPVRIGSFEPASLQLLANDTDFRLIQLISGPDNADELTPPEDQEAGPDLTSRSALREIRGYACGIGVSKDLVIPRNLKGRLRRPTSLIKEAHGTDLTVHGWTFSRENRFLPARFRVTDDPYQPGNLAGEIGAFRSAGMDGFFTDNPDLVVFGLDQSSRLRPKVLGNGNPHRHVHPRRARTPSAI
jgi:glycerophosphoryl diester phosphodiesterase